MNVSPVTRSAFLRPWLIWTVGFVSFPIAGVAGAAVVGRVDSPVAALAGGVITGVVIGAGQSLASSRRLDPRRWIVATAVGMGVGLLLGAMVVGFGTSLTDLAVMGAVTGLVLGGAQAVALSTRVSFRWAWAAAIPVLWALGWTLTTLAKVDVDKQYTVFGAAGAVTFSAMSGVLLHWLIPGRTTTAAARLARTKIGPHRTAQRRVYGRRS